MNIKCTIIVIYILYVFICVYNVHLHYNYKNIFTFPGLIRKIKMSCLLLFILIVVSMNACIGLDSNSIMEFGVQHPRNTDDSLFAYVAKGPGCGINYGANTIYFVGGISTSNENNPDYITWNALESTDWINNNDYSNIVSPSFKVTPIEGNILTTIPGYNNGEWFCEFVECTAQINQNPYIYIVGPNVNVRNGVNARETSSMLIYDMDSNNYIESIKYKYTVPGVAKTGNHYIKQHIF